MGQVMKAKWLVYFFVINFSYKLTKGRRITLCLQAVVKRIFLFFRKWKWRSHSNDNISILARWPHVSLERLRRVPWSGTIQRSTCGHWEPQWNSTAHTRDLDLFANFCILVCFAIILSLASHKGIQSPLRFCHPETRWIWCWDDLIRHLSGNKPARLKNLSYSPQNVTWNILQPGKLVNSRSLNVESTIFQRKIQVNSSTGAKEIIYKGSVTKSWSLCQN